ncbi:MFS transporter [Actinophytocola sp. NPDC049390]|uniref:MFS transporter n=1 Tax=Actinophytocola sp. NPDC049390 TaxID=3363894 RepID=UPI0037975E60
MVVAVFLGTFMSLLDVSVVNVALPAMQHELSAGFSTIQWVVDSYTLCLSALILTGGSLADRFGRKRLYLGGLGVFVLGSLLCAVAASTTLLIVGRLVQGVGAAAVAPGALSLLVQGFPETRQQARMIGLWGACVALAVVVGPLVGGVLTDAFGWPAIFLINLPLGAVAIVAGLRGITESADPAHAGADPAGQVLAVGWLAALTYAVLEAGHRGWDSPLILSLLALAVVLFAVFVVVERKVARPMLPAGLFARPRFAVVTFSSFVLGFGAYGSFYLLSLFLQQVQGASAAETGVRFLPYSLGIAAGSVLGGRIGGDRVMLAGYTMIGGGLLSLLLVQPESGYPLIGVLFAVLGVGMGFAITTTNSAGVSAVGRERSGTAAATVNAARQTGTALGIAALGAIVNANLGTKSGADFAAGFTTGLHWALVLAGGLTLVAAALVAAGQRALSQSDYDIAGPADRGV